MLFRKRIKIPVMKHAALPPVDWKPELSYHAYCDAFNLIKAAILAGETYQTNLTYRWSSIWHGDPLQLLNGISTSNQSAYGAYIDTADWTICSASPELFFSRTGAYLTTKPMKGTAPRRTDPAEDRLEGISLQNSAKNRAENLMIVDMLRNDLGKTADAGSVQVPHLFSLEKYPTVWQLTSTVTARSSAPLSEILRALFPCASITGAPKGSAMALIRRVEHTARSIYTGTIGFLEPGGYSQFNVAIRTLIYEKAPHRLRYYSGGGIVWDSDCREEWHESRCKQQFLTPAATLLTTMRCGSTGRPLLREHLRRLHSAARRFNIPFDRNRFLQKIPPRPTGNTCCKLRITVSPGGIQSEQTPAPRRGTPVQLRFAQRPVNPDDQGLRWKTTDRSLWDQLSLTAHKEEEDTLLWNRYREITETVIANLVILLDGKLLTPAAECGVLPGTRRGALLGSGRISEAHITVEMLYGAAAVWTISDLRGWRPAKLPPRPTADFFSAYRQSI